MKKLVSLLLVLAMVLSCAGALAEDVTLTFAASQNWVNGDRQ